jgi:hypothetical protein
MPRRKKEPREMTTEEAIRHLFPPQVVREVKKVANPPEKPQVRPSKRSIEKKSK